MAVDDEAAQLYAVSLEPGNGDDDYYMAMRRLLLVRKEAAGKLRRQTWKQNGMGYVAYRNYIRACKRGDLTPPDSPTSASEGMDTFPSINVTPTNQHAALHALRSTFSSPSPTVRDGGSPLQLIGRAASFGNSPGKDLHRRLQKGEVQTGYSFGGVYCIFDECKAAVNCIRFGRQTPDLLAYGAANGMLRVCKLSPPPRIAHYLNGHTKEVTDFDWSVSDDFLCSASMDKSVRVWDAATGACLRIIYSKVAHLCIRFHPLNNNLLVVGDTNNELTVTNFSTGRTVGRLSMESRVTAMETGPPTGPVANIFFVGDSQGCVHSIKVDSLTGVPQRMHRNHSGVATWAPTTGLQFSPFSRLAQGAVLLACSLDGSLRYFSTAIEVDGYLSLRCSLQLAPRARKSRACFCPPQPNDRSELIVTGSDDHNIYFYDITKLKHPLVGKLQGHGAPVVATCWNQGENLLATSDCDGLVIVWRRNMPFSS